ncbi:MAG: serine protease [Flavobacteriaceae bacterium]|nr:serine protease [Flavobacteriaceae bacterium]
MKNERKFIVMKIKSLIHLLLAGLFVFCQSCSKDSGNPNPITPPSSIDIVGLSKIEDILNGDDQNLIDLLNIVRGSVGKRGSASKTIWSRKNIYGLGLYISANHVYNINGWNSRSAEFFDITSENLGIFETSQIPPTSGDIVFGNTLIADFPLIHFDISPSATNTSILPSEDFYIGIIDNQRVKQGDFPQYPNLVQINIPLNMYDPYNRTKLDQTWNTPYDGENAILVGYPQDEENYPNGVVVTGKILSDLEAETIIDELKAAGDSEGDIPYNSLVEFFIEAQGLAGMSGGGAFNSDGELLGIMVRASDTENAPRVIRVVKITHIKSKLNEFYNDLSQADKEKINSFISGEI